MFGADKISDAEFKKLLTQTDILESDKQDKKGFVTVNDSALGTEAFKLDATRVTDLIQIVQYLEMTKHDISEQVEARVKQ